MLVYRGLRPVPIDPLVQCELFVLPAGKVVKAGYLRQGAKAGNKPPQVLGSGFYQHALISCSHCYTLQVSWRVGPSHHGSGTQAEGVAPVAAPHPGRRKDITDRVLALSVSASTCHLSLPFHISLAKASHLAVPNFKENEAV